MRKPNKMVGILLIGGIILIQFFQPERNLGTVETENALVTVTRAPDNLAAILKNSCYDCHSNRTVYPWYSYISPLSWFLEKHIQEGKEALNMSEFGTLEKNQKIGVLADICDVIESGSMPLQSYLIIHKSALVQENDKEAICSWSESEALKIMRE
ncbi:MAG: heme-binding domain-containing protein [Bacteroidota bacterium]